MGKKFNEIPYAIRDDIFLEKEYWSMKEKETMEVFNTPLGKLQKCVFCGGFFAGWHQCYRGKESIHDLVLRKEPDSKSFDWNKVTGCKDLEGVDTVKTVETSGEKTAKSVMVGGTHYKGGIQPIDFYHANPQLDFQECNMIKYAYRHKSKNGLQDLLKVVHYAMLEADLYYKSDSEFKQMIKGLM